MRPEWFEQCLMGKLYLHGIDPPSCVARVVAICYGSNCQGWHVTKRFQCNANNLFTFQSDFSTNSFFLAVVSLERACSFTIDVFWWRWTSAYHVTPLSLCQDPLINNNWKLFKGHFDPVWSEFVAGKIRYISQHVWPCSSSISWHLGNFFTELVTWHPSATQAFPHTLQNNLLPRQRQFDENSL